jgi:hypothetical protein
MRREPLTSATDRRVPIPVGSDERAHAIGNALRSLASEQRRLERLGLVLAIDRLRDERRYWAFLEALYRLADAPRSREAA